MPIPVLSGIADGLNLYQRNVVDPIAGTGLQALNRAKLGLGLGDDGSQLINQMDPKSALDYAFQDNPWGRFAVTSVADPLNYVGLGLPGMAGKFAAKVGLDAIPGVVGGLDALSKADSLPGELGGKALDAIGSGLGHFVGDPIGNALYPHITNAAGTGFADTHPNLAQNWQSANQVWKSLAHLIPSYGITNLMDDTSRAAFNGDTDAVGGIANTLLGRRDNLVNKWEDALGDTPESVDTAAAMGLGDNPTSPLRRASLLPSSHPFPPSNLQSWLDRAPAPVQWGADRLADMNEAQLNWEAKQERLIRGNVFGSNADKYVGSLNESNQLGSPGFTADTIEAMGGGTGKYDDIAQMLRDRQVMPPDELYAHLQSAGMTSHAINGLIEDPGAYRDSLDEAAGYGNAVTNAQQFDMRTPPNASDAEKFWRATAQNTFGGYKFATQNVPTFLRMATGHPGILGVPNDYYRNSDLYNATHGLPESYHGEMPMGNVGGRDIFINPFGASSLVGLAGEMSDKSNDSDMSPLGQVANSAGKLGLGLNPMINTALTATGQYGSEQERPLFRALNPISGLVDLITQHPTDLEQPIKGAVSSLEQGLTGRQTFPYQDYLTRRRAVELGGGNPMAVDNSQDMDAASHDIATQMGLQNILSSVGVPSMHLLTPEERIIDMNQHQGAVAQAHGNPNLAAANPTKGAYDLADPLNEEIYKFDSLPWIQQQQLLLDPVARQKIIEQKSQLIHGGPGGYVVR